MGPGFPFFGWCSYPLFLVPLARIRAQSGTKDRESSVYVQERILLALALLKTATKFVEGISGLGLEHIKITAAAHRIMASLGGAVAQ